MMLTDEQIVLAQKCCAKDTCLSCPLHGNAVCFDELCDLTARAFVRLVRENAELRDRLAREG